MFFSCCRFQAHKLIQRFPPKSNFKPYFIARFYDLKPLNSKLSNYMKNGLVEEAQNLFDTMPRRSTVTWNTMVRGYFQNGISEKAISIYNEMPARDIFSYNTVISGLMQCGDVKGAEEIFVGMEDRDIVTWNSMISGYVDNGMVDEAVRMFTGMPVRDVVSWNLLIAGLVKVKEVGLAEDLFRRMPAQDVASWTIMMKGFLSAGRIVDARECFDDMPIKDIQAWNTLMIGYIENGCVEIAEALFHKMPERDWSSWNEVINGLVSVERMKDAMRFFFEMPQKHVRSWNLVLLGFIGNGLVMEAHAFLEKLPFGDVVSWTSMIVGYFDIGEVKNAIKLFDSMSDRDTTAWNATIFGLGENDHIEDGMKLFIRMKEEDLTQDEATITSMLGAMFKHAILESGCGSMDNALLEFSSMLCHDVISWNSIICGLAHHGHGEHALQMFENMISKDVKPNQITFIGVLSACSHAGLVEQGKYYFDAMKNECSLLPMSEHYTCIVDLLGRFGLIDEAVNILDQMKLEGLEVPASVWGALLGACRIYKNFIVGEIAGEKVLELQPSNSGVYMILAEMFLASGRRKDAERMWVRMKDEGVKKQPGCSWIESNHNSHIFLAGDRTHSQFCSISCILDLMYGEMEIGIFRQVASSSQDI